MCELRPSDHPARRQAHNRLPTGAVSAERAGYGPSRRTLMQIPPFHPYFRKDIPIGGADIPGAKKLLAEAGIPSGWDLEMYVPGSNPARQRLPPPFPRTAQQARITLHLRLPPPHHVFAPTPAHERLSPA